jgi:alpha-beta hydrolase superfamily lysophospholipase
MEAIRYYVKGAFVGVAETPEVLEQQEELVADMTAKVADLVADGRSQDEALGMAIASVGDLSALVKEFATDDAGADADKPAEPAVVEVYVSRLRLHVVALTAGGAVALLFVLTVLGVFAGAVRGTSAASDILLGLFAVGWIGFELWRFHRDSEAVATVEVTPKGMQLRLLQWVVVCAFAMALNLAGGDDFWAWTVWIGAAAWPATLWVQRALVERGKFLHPKVEPAADVAADCALVHG